MEEKILGVDIKLFLGLEEGREILLGGQKDATLNRSRDSVEVTNKNSGGFKEKMPGLMEWSIDTSGFMIKDDHTFDILEDAFNEGRPLSIKFKNVATGEVYKGKVIITDFPLEAPQDDAYTYKLTLEGTGAYTKVTENPSATSSATSSVGK